MNKFTGLELKSVIESFKGFMLTFVYVLDIRNIQQNIAQKMEYKGFMIYLEQQLDIPLFLWPKLQI